MAAVPTEVGGEAAGMINVARYLGAVLVVALGTLLSTQVSVNQLDDRLAREDVTATRELELDRAMSGTGDELERAVADTASSSSVDRTTIRADVEATVAGFRGAELLIAVVTLGAAGASWVLFAREGRDEAPDAR
ncbi:MAG: hypothetical protein U5R31_11560 [Acidimicrobiia bacterium]|nr:hypothetical protein [Acidimicrobiia bacterium]